MQKINVIMPVSEQQFDLAQKTKELKVTLKKYENEFNVFFVANYKLQKPKAYFNSQNFKLVETNLKTTNELIKKGFEEVLEGAIIVLDAKDNNYIEVLDKLIENKTDSNIVLHKPIYKKSKIKSNFEKLFIKLYFAYLKFWGLEKDLLCSNTNQYFNENAVKVIKSLNKKNAYLRNFETLTGYEVKIIKEEVEKVSKTAKLVSFKNNNTLIGVIAFSVGLVFALITLIFTKLILAIDNGIGLYFLLLVFSVGTMFLSVYLIVKDVIKTKGDL